MAKKKLVDLPVGTPLLMRVRNKHMLVSAAHFEQLCELVFSNTKEAEDWLFAHGYQHYRRLGEAAVIEDRSIDPTLFEGSDEGESIRL